MRISLEGLLLRIAVLPALAIASSQTASYPTYQWHTFFGGDASDAANLPATVVDAYGNLYVTGWTQYPWDQNGNPISSVPLNFFEAYLTKISPTGQLLWSQFYTGYGQSSSGLQATAITLDSAGNIYIAGNGNVINDGTYGCFVMETDNTGTMLGGANIGFSNYNRSCAVYGITYDPAQNYVYITGMTQGGWRGGSPVNNGQAPNGTLPSNGASAMFILQAQGVGSSVALGWVGFYYNSDASGNGSNAYGRAITVDASSNLYVAGTDNGNSGWNVAVWKVSNVGQQAWETVYGLGVSYAVAVYGSNVYVGGFSPAGWNGPGGQSPLNTFQSGNGCCAVAMVLKLDTSGNYAWHTFYHGDTYQTIAEGIAVDGPSTVYVTGQGDLVGYNNAAPLHGIPDTENGGHYILQLDDTGAYQWHSLYAGTRWDEASAIAVDPQHDVYVSGWTGYISWTGDNDTPPLHFGSGAASEVFVMKFSPPAATTTTASSVAITYSPNSQNITLNATVTSTATVNSGTVSFTLLGTTVSPTVVNGSASTGFTVPGGTLASNYTIQATYNPGAGLLSSSDNSKQLTIGKATPAITWANPADIPYGTPLSATQLNATANVAGTFVYNPPATTVLPVGNAQTLSTTFTPTDSADYTTASGSVLINVTNVTPTQPVTVSPTALGFGIQGLNSPTAAKMVTVNNNQSSPTSLSFSVIGANRGDFIQSATTCGSTLGAGSSCTISFQFAPTAMGPRAATLTFSGTPDAVQPTVSLTGTGAQPVTALPAALGFGSQGLNSPTAAKTVTVTNNQSSPTSLSFSVTGPDRGDFIQSATTCGSTLGAESSCTISFQFAPTAMGLRVAALTFSGTPDAFQPVVGLVGIGVQPVTVSPAALGFGSQGLNSPTASRTVTVNNNQSSPTNLSFSVTGADRGDFIQSANTCGSTLGAGSSCTISFQFAPTATGPRTATLTFSGTPDAVQPTVSLTGTGVQPVTVSPTTLGFGSQGLNSPTAAKTVRVSNNNQSSQTSLSFSVTGANPGDFIQSANTCGSMLGAGSSCTISFRFAPTATGARTATLTFSGTPDAVQPTVSLTGTGVEPVTVSPTTLGFGSQRLNSPTAARTITVSNHQSSPTGLSFSVKGANPGDFIQSATTCGSLLGAESSCTISFRFAPTATGARAATLTFSGTPDAVQPTVTLTGTGV